MLVIEADRMFNATGRLRQMSRYTRDTAYDES